MPRHSCKNTMLTVSVLLNTVDFTNLRGPSYSVRNWQVLWFPCIRVAVVTTLHKLQSTSISLADPNIFADIPINCLTAPSCIQTAKEKENADCLVVV